ncbi:MAG: signal peptidase [Haloarculaceae archaeon]
MRRYVSLALQITAVVLVGSLVLGSVLGQPILLGFVETGSMEPTLDPGDGFVAIPAAVAGPIEEGDVVVFEAEEIQGGGLTTHRIVDETDRGFITRGDANPFTDQDSEEPPVQDAQIAAVVWQPGGEVLSIPGVGTVVTGTQSTLLSVQRTLAALLGTRSLLGVQGLAYLLFAATAILYVVDVWRDDGTDRERSRSRDTGTSARLVVAVFAGAIVLAATAAMVAPAGTQEIGVVSAEFNSPGMRVVEQGTTESTQQLLGNGGLLPVVSIFETETEGLDIQPRVVTMPGGSTANATLSVSAPPETGFYRYFLTEHRYLHVLPLSTIQTLHGIHPWAPILVIDALLGIPFYLLGMSLVGTGRIRSRDREKPSRLRRLISKIS